MKLSTFVPRADWRSFLVGGLLAADAVNAVHLPSRAQHMFDESMSFMDTIYDKSVSYLYYFYFPLAAGPHETRSSVWYALGLLQRNRGDDAHEAVKILTNVIDGQYKDPADQWYGDYQYYPETPTVGTSAYPKSIYGSWDPNWRGFIGTTLIVIYEEFGHLLPHQTQELILESMYNNTKGDYYRVGGVDEDNLYPSYSNPWLMRCIVTGWTGRKFHDKNMTRTGEEGAAEALELFNRNNTLSEFNSATYAGISLMALTMWDKYMPQDSLMKQNGARMVRDVWEYTAALYNPVLNNIAGPWDRAYGYDMNKYVGILSLYFWTLLGKEQAFPQFPEVWSMAHADDFEIAPVLAVLAPHHDGLIPQATKDKLARVPGEDDELFERSAYSPPADLAPRNITTWLSRNITIGAESFAETAVGGPRVDSSQWNPAVIQWLRSRDNSVGYFTLQPSEKSLDAVVAPGWLNLTLPEGNSSSVFTFLVPTNPLGGKRDIWAVEDIEGVNLKVGGNVKPQPDIGFCGLVGGTCDVIHGFEFWNLTYTMPEGCSDRPFISIHIEEE